MTRFTQAQALLARGGRGCLLSHQPNISYLAGFSVHDSFLLLTQKRSILITDSRYAAEYRTLAKDPSLEIVIIKKIFAQTLNTLCHQLRIKQLAFEERFTSFAAYTELCRSLNISLIPLARTIENLRIIKDKEEIRNIQKATQITLRALSFAKKIIKPGQTERAIAAEIERFIRLQGARTTSFDIIVASGPHSSYPHAMTTQRKLHIGEPVLIDMGVDYAGYKSDLTRMFFLGKMSLQFKTIYHIVKTAQRKALKLIKPGTPLGRIDNAARGFIAKKGYAAQFKHSLGHGVGLEVHEEPRVAPNNRKRLKQNMVFTLEPAIYLDGLFGVRIEDMVVVRKGSGELLSDNPN